MGNERRKTDKQLDRMSGEDLEAHIHALEQEHLDLRAYRIRVRQALDRVLTGQAYADQDDEDEEGTD